MRLLNALIMLLMVFVAILLGFGFALLNSAEVLVSYYIGSRTMPLSLLVLGSLILGLMMGWLAALGTILKAKIKKH